MVMEAIRPQCRGRGRLRFHSVRTEADRRNARCGCGAIQLAGFAYGGGLIGDHRQGLDAEGRGAFCNCDGGAGILCFG